MHVHGYIILTYLGPSLLQEQKPSTTPRQHPLSWALFSSSRQVCPVFLVSASRSRRQVFLGLPLFLFPCGFQVGVCLVMLENGFRSVWPIRPHFLFMTSASTRACWVPPLPQVPVADGIWPVYCSGFCAGID